MSEEFLTRRQLRELERTGQSRPATPEAKPEQTATAAFVLPPEVLNPVLALKAPEHDETPSRRLLREQQNSLTSINISEVDEVSSLETQPAPAATQKFFELKPVIPAPAATEQNIEPDESLFDVSPNLSLEPQTASIIVDQFNDITNITQMLENGEILQTGSITLPVLSTNTGELALVTDAQFADEAVAADSTTGYVSSIAPVRAADVGNFGAQLKIVPPKHQPGEGQLYLALTISVGLVAIGALILGGYMLNLFN